MDIKNFISSGILENYVLGLASAEERAQVETYAAQHAVVREELQAIEVALEVYGRAKAITPPTGAEERTLQKIKGNHSSSPKNPPPSKRGPWLGLLGLLTAIAAIAAFFFYQKEQDRQQELLLTQSTLDSLQSDCNEVQQVNTQVRQENDQLRNKLLLLTTEGNLATEMKGTDLAPTALATVYRDIINQKSYLAISNLPTPPTDKQYQLWAIVDGAPVDMGVFDMHLDLADLQEVPFIENAQAFAVTLEPLGGNPTPTLEHMYVIGNVS